MKQALLAALALWSLVASGQRAEAHPRDGGLRSGAYTLEVVDEHGRSLRTFQHHGRTYVLGASGQRYLLRVHNHSPSRIEVVASVDGRDVIDGRPALMEKRGYIVDGYGDLTIDGFRTSDATVAAFRFSTVSKSYAAQMGDARDVGVVGVAVFAERYVPPPPPVAYSYPMGQSRMQEESAADSAAGAPSVSRGPSMEKKAESRSGLGTQFAEEHHSQVSHVEFVRASSQPSTVMSLRYNDRRGLIALGIDVDGARTARNEVWMRESANPFRGNGYAQPPPNWLR